MQTLPRDASPLTVYSGGVKSRLTSAYLSAPLSSHRVLMNSRRIIGKGADMPPIRPYSAPARMDLPPSKWILNFHIGHTANDRSLGKTISGEKNTNARRESLISVADIQLAPRAKFGINMKKGAKTSIFLKTSPLVITLTIWAQSAYVEAVYFYFCAWCDRETIMVKPFCRELNWYQIFQME